MTTTMAETPDKSLGRITVIIVTFNSQDTIKECIDSVPEQCAIVVVDQSPGKDVAVALSELTRDVCVLRSGANRGFGAGCNLGAANCDTELLLFLNPDATVTSEAIVELVQAHRQLGGIIGPDYTSNGSGARIQVYRRRSALRDAAQALAPERLLPPILRSTRHVPRSTQSPIDVPYVLGACMLISRTEFWNAGAFDERYFLYGEEASLSEAMRALGFNTYLAPSAIVTHLGGTSTGRRNTFVGFHYYRSRAIYLSRQGFLYGLGSVLFITLALSGGSFLALVRNSFASLVSVCVPTDYTARWYIAGIRGLWNGLVFSALSESNLAEPPRQGSA